MVRSDQNDPYRIFLLLFTSITSLHCLRIIYRKYAMKVFCVNLLSGHRDFSETLDIRRSKFYTLYNKRYVAYIDYAKPSNRFWIYNGSFSVCNMPCFLEAMHIKSFQASIINYSRVGTLTNFTQINCTHYIIIV